MTSGLNNHHRNTLAKIFAEPASGNIEWRHVTSLLDAVGTTVEKHNGNLEVTIGSNSRVLHPPRGKDIDEQMVVDLRRMLAQAGLSPDEAGTTR